MPRKSVADRRRRRPAALLHDDQEPRRGVILFGLEFGSNRWSCVPYCEFLREAGYDIFALRDARPGQKPTPNGYEPLQWVTEFEVTTSGPRSPI